MDWACVDYIEKKKDDVTGLTPPSDLTLTKADNNPPRFNLYDRFLSYPPYVLSDAPCNLPEIISASSPPGGWQSIEGDDGELVAKLLADTNPFRYTVSVPVMIAELLEAGSLLKLASNNFFSLVGSAHLNQVFGWEPMIQDLKALSKITTEIENRIKEFNALVSKGGSRRRVHLWNQKVSTVTTAWLYSSYQGAWADTVDTTYESRVWGSVRWVPNRTSPIDLAKLTAFNEAMRIVLDLRIPDASTIWEAIPFSWLVDYFLNVGDSLQAIEDTDKVLPRDICIMRERVTTQRNRGFSDSNEGSGQLRVVRLSMTTGEVRRITKIRGVYNPTHAGDLLSFGFMSRKQSHNLIALLMSLVRFKR